MRRAAEQARAPRGNSCRVPHRRHVSCSALEHVVSGHSHHEGELGRYTSVLTAADAALEPRDWPARRRSWARRTTIGSTGGGSERLGGRTRRGDALAAATRARGADSSREAAPRAPSRSAAGAAASSLGDRFEPARGATHHPPSRVVAGALGDAHVPRRCAPRLARPASGAPTRLRSSRWARPRSRIRHEASQFAESASPREKGGRGAGSHAARVQATEQRRAASEIVHLPPMVRPLPV